MKDQETIDILLSTFQSEKYLEEQIDSILNQRFSNWKLIVRDDGSSDKTISIIEHYIQLHPERIHFLLEKKNNIGVIKSFETLLKKSQSNYIMFCDHDDVWLPNKIDITLQEMNELEKEYPNLPLLVHTDLTVVDELKNELYASYWNLSKINPYLLSKFNYLGICNSVTGCTMMINKKAKEICLPFPDSVRMHDSWMALCVAKKGKIGFVNDSTILYRQHQTNQIGAKDEKKLLAYIHAKIQNIKQTILDNKKQRAMLNNLKYGNRVKYLFYKFLYFLRTRL